MPAYVVVTGLPASGKSTIANAIAPRLGLPVIDKDRILETLFDSHGTVDWESRGTLSREADRLMERAAVDAGAAVLVSWWRHPLSREQSGSPTAWLASLPGRLIELHCACPPDVAAARFFARTRHVGHLDRGRSPEAELERFKEVAAAGAFGVGRLVECDTSRVVDLPALVAEINAAVGRRADDSLL